MTALFQTWGAPFEWAWFASTIIGILLIALRWGWARGWAPGQRVLTTRNNSAAEPSGWQRNDAASFSQSAPRSF